MIFFLQCFQAVLKITLLKSDIRKIFMHRCKVRDPGQISSGNNKRVAKHYQAINENLEITTHAWKFLF